MINQFLKVGGVANLKDFYKKFPTQAHFDNYVKMKYGGGINAYANGGFLRSYQGDAGGSTVTAPPRRADYMDNEEQWQADMDAYSLSQGTGASKRPAVGKDGMTDYIRRPQEEAAAATPATAPAAKSKLNPYGGASIVDFLGAQGKAADFANRKKLAEAMGISGYTGKAGENTKLLKMLQSSPELLDSYASGPTSGGGSRSGGGGGKKKLARSPNKFFDNMLYQGETVEDMLARQAMENPYVMAPGNQISQNPFGLPGGASGQPGQSEDDNDAPSIWPYVGIGAGAGVGYGTYKEIQSILNGIKTGKFQPTGQMKDKLNELRNNLIKDAGVNVKNQASWFKKLPKAQQNILKNLDAMEISGDIHTMPSGTASRDLYTRDMLNEARAEQSLMSDKAAKEALQEAKTEASILRKSKVSNVAPNVTSAAAPGYFEGAKKSLRQGVAAAKEAGIVKDAMKLYKFFGKIRGLEHGGEADDLDMLHHYYKLKYLQNGGYMDYDNAYMNDGEGSYAYGGQPNFGYYQEGGEENEGDWGVPNWLKTTAQVLDPTGISSWGDAGRAIKNAYNNPGWGSIGGAALETLGAIPVIGKIGKGIKIAKAVGQGEKVAKVSTLAKAGQKIMKPINAVHNVRIPYTQMKPLKAIEQIDNYLPFQRITGAIPTKIVSKAPKAVQTAVKIGNDGNRFGRWNKGAGALWDGAESAILDESNQPTSTPRTNNRYSQGGYHGNPGVYSDGYSGTSSGGQYFQEGGAFVPSYGDSAYALPQYNWGANYQEGGMAPEQMAPQEMAPEQPSEGGGMDPQQVMQEVAQMLQQGAQPEQVMQQLVQQGIPEEVAQQIIQQVMQQMQGGGAEQQAPPQQRYGGRYAKGGISAGQEMDVSPEQMEALRQQGYKFDII